MSSPPGAARPAGAGAVKLVLKPWKATAALDQQQGVALWLHLRAAIERIHRREVGELSFEELYRHSYHLVLHKHGELLYNGVVEAVRYHLAKMADEVRRAADEQLLARLREAWDTHQREMRNVRDILMYMDR